MAENHFLIPAKTLDVPTPDDYQDTGESQKPYPFRDEEDVYLNHPLLKDDPGFLESHRSIAFVQAFVFKASDKAKPEVVAKWEAWCAGKAPIPTKRLNTLWKMRNAWHAKREWMLEHYGHSDPYALDGDDDEKDEMHKNWIRHRDEVWAAAKAAGAKRAPAPTTKRAV